jgi:hypothetical protein
MRITYAAESLDPDAARDYARALMPTPHRLVVERIARKNDGTRAGVDRPLALAAMRAAGLRPEHGGEAVTKRGRTSST